MTACSWGNQNGEVIRWVLTGGRRDGRVRARCGHGLRDDHGLHHLDGRRQVGTRSWTTEATKWSELTLIQHCVAALDRKGLVVATQSGEVLALDGQGVE